MRQEELRKKYKDYQDKLLQVTKKNRSVLFKSVQRKQNFDLADLEDLKTGVVNKVLTKAIKNIGSILNEQSIGNQKQNILLDSITNDDADIARRKLKILKRNLSFIEEESGQQTGYLGFPFLEGRIDSEFYVRGPIVLFPISIEYKGSAKNGGWFLHFENKLPILNGALITALKKKGGYDLPENYEDIFDDMIEEAKDIGSPDLFFIMVKSWISKLIPIDETLNKSKNTKIEVLNQNKLQKIKNQNYHIVNYAIIGNFPQADNQIYRDYNKLIERADTNKIINKFFDYESQDSDTEKFHENHSKINGKDIQFNFAFESDASQDQVILESKNSDLVVVRGPPGTGKSQVIVNLITDALTNNKKILVVCQKRAALEVVSQRLGKIGLDKYVVFFGKESDDRTKMYQQLCEIIEKEPDPISNSEKNIEEISNDIDKCINYLVDFGEALQDDYMGATAHKIYSHANSHYKPVLDLSSNLDLEWKNLDKYIQDIANIEESFKQFENDDHPWFGRKNFIEFGILDKNQMSTNLDELLEIIPNCIFTNDQKSQIRLNTLFNIFTNDPGFLKIKRRKARKECSRILNMVVTNQFILDSHDKIKNGIEFWKKFENLLNIFDNDKSIKLRCQISDPDLLKSSLIKLKYSLEQFTDLQEFDKNKNEARKKYGELFFDILAQAKLHMDKDSNWAENIRQEIYIKWFAQIEQKNPILKGDPISNYELKKAELANLIKTKQKIIIKTIKRKIKESINQNDVYGSITITNMKSRAFYKELKRKRKVKPVRKLFEEYSEQMFKIAPCWLMSPETVSKIFPLEKEIFDLVIVDEASQLPVERSIPFLYRAKHVVIAGDEKQLPPFDLFQIKEDEDEDEDIAEQSLLEHAKVRYKTTNLSWHYRSKYQELIDFSNHAFYKGLLNVAPNIFKNQKHPPIKWITCDNGVWDNQINTVEATRVVEEIKHILNERSRNGGIYPSIGVITFNEKQQEKITDIIENTKESDDEFSLLYAAAHANARKDDTLFVKNIENVQGDERDIIIFSIGYAKDPDGKFVNMFGTINREGGENRLNVAITRAREAMIVVSSISPEYIKETSKNDGPRLLRKFLEYAKMVDRLDIDGKKIILQQIRPDMPRDKKEIEFDSDFEKQVYNKLEKRGYEVDTQIGSSGYKIDLGIVHPDDNNRYILGIECDGATFHSAKSVKERDVMRQKFLESKGWRIERIWSRNWWRNSEQEIDRIESVIKNLI